ncbi:hypothetical protein HK097_008972, partial [Rhizophlyctis rosea]
MTNGSAGSSPTAAAASSSNWLDNNFRRSEAIKLTREKAVQQFPDDNRPQEWLQYHPFGADAPPEGTYFKLQSLAKNPPAEEATFPGEPPEISQGVRELRKVALDSFAMPHGGFEYMTFSGTLDGPPRPSRGLNLDGKVPSHMRGVQSAQQRGPRPLQVPPHANHQRPNPVSSALSRPAPPSSNPPPQPNSSYPPPSASSSGTNKRLDTQEKDLEKPKLNGLGPVLKRTESASSSKGTGFEKKAHGAGKDAEPPSPRVPRTAREDGTNGLQAWRAVFEDIDYNKAVNGLPIIRDDDNLFFKLAKRPNNSDEEEHRSKKQKLSPPNNDRRAKSPAPAKIPPQPRKRFVDPENRRNIEESLLKHNADFKVDPAKPLLYDSRKVPTQESGRPRSGTPSKKGKSHASAENDKDSKVEEEDTKPMEGRTIISAAGKKSIKTDADDEKVPQQNGKAPSTSSSPVESKEDKAGSKKLTEKGHARSDEIPKKDAGDRKGRSGDLDGRMSEADKTVLKKQGGSKDKEDARKGRNGDSEGAHRDDRQAKKDDRQNRSKGGREEERKESARVERDDQRFEERSRTEGKGEEKRGGKGPEPSSRVDTGRVRERSPDWKASTSRDQSAGSSRNGKGAKTSAEKSDDERARSSAQKTVKQTEDDRIRRNSIESSNGASSKGSGSTPPNATSPKRRRGDEEVVKEKEDTKDEPLHFKKKKKDEAPMSPPRSRRPSLKPRRASSLSRDGRSASSSQKSKGRSKMDVDLGSGANRGGASQGRARDEMDVDAPSSRRGDRDKELDAMDVDAPSSRRRDREEESDTMDVDVPASKRGKEKERDTIDIDPVPSPKRTDKTSPPNRGKGGGDSKTEEERRTSADSGIKGDGSVVGSPAASQTASTPRGMDGGASRR